MTILQPGSAGSHAAALSDVVETDLCAVDPDVAQASTSGPDGDEDSPNVLTIEHRDHLRAELGSDDGVELAIRYGVRSLSKEQAIAAGYRVWMGREAPPAGTSGIEFPFSDSFGQLRFDGEILNRKGSPVGKYRNKSGSRQAIAIISTATENVPDAELATEGWKDAARLALATGRTTAALPGVGTWRLLPESVRYLVYDADARSNPGVWSPLIQAAIARPALRVGFFPEKTAGPKGGACEHYRVGGTLEDVRWYRAKDLIRELWQDWTRRMRPEWKARSLWTLGRLAYAAGFDRDAVDDILRSAARKIGIPADRVKVLLIRLWAIQPGARSDTPVINTRKELQEFLTARHSLAFDALSKSFTMDGRPMEARAIEHFDHWLAERYSIEVDPRTAGGALRYVAQGQTFNPVEHYLRTVRERDDLQPVRLADLGRAFGFADDDWLSRDMLARHLVGALKRGLRPGFKNDQMLILCGRQGARKSAAIAALSPHSDWSDSETEVKDLTGWNFLLRVSGCWHYVVDECDQILRSRSAAEVKGVLTRSSDRFPLKYSNTVQSWARPSVWWGTTNCVELLNDHTGARRFWVCPVVSDCDPGWISRNRDALWFTVWKWAENGLRNFYDLGSTFERAARNRAVSASFDDLWASKIHAYLSSLSPDTQGVAVATVAEVALGKSATDSGSDVRGRISRIVEAQSFTTHGGTLKWVKDRGRWNGPKSNPVAGFRPVPAEVESDEPPATVDYSWELDPVDVCQSCQSVPQGWHSYSPWYDCVSDRLCQCASDSEEKSVGEEHIAEDEQVGGDQSPDLEPDRGYIHSPIKDLGENPGTPAQMAQNPGQDSVSSVPASRHTARHTDTESGTEPGTTGTDSTSVDSNRTTAAGDRPLTSTDAPEFSVGSTWRDPQNPRTLSGRECHYRVWTADSGGVVLARHERAAGGNSPVVEQGIPLTAELRGRLQPLYGWQESLRLLPDDDRENAIAVAVFRANPSATGAEIHSRLTAAGLSIPAKRVPALQLEWFRQVEGVA